MVDERLNNKRNELRGILKSEALTDHQRRDYLYFIWHKTVMKAATHHLGQAPDRPTSDNTGPSLPVQWTLLLDQVSLLLRTNMISHLGTECNHAELSRLTEWFAEQGVSLPTCKRDWSKWWPRRDTHRADALLSRQDLVLTDKMAQNDPKRFYKLATGPTSVSSIDSLLTQNGIITDDGAIEAECEKFLRGLGGEPSAQEEGREQQTHPPDPRLSDILRDIGINELREIAADMDQQSCAGHDTLSPKLLKTVLLTNYNKTTQKTDADKHADGLHWQFSTEMERMRSGWSKMGPSTNSRIPPPNTYDDVHDVMHEPHWAPYWLTRIMNLCIKTRNIPKSEKLGVVSALPKAEGQIYNLANIRPITVGPAVNRLYHKLLADRLSTAICKHGIMDAAQFAFLPGKDIHEPINSIIACYRDRQLHNKSCYAIFYDISKAYDTVRWSSIDRAMARLGLPPDFRDMIMNALEGTRLVMRTNRQGRITKEIHIHRAIKQGCPLAPLLFTMVMDELHTELRATQGYTMGPTGEEGKYETIHSRGYCDDTVIVSSSLSGIKEMDSIVRRFFHTHGFAVNATKTKLTGRQSNTQACEERVQWEGHAPFTTITPNTPIRHLGCWVSMDLNWDTQISKMRATVLHTVASLDGRRLSLLQARHLIKYVTGPMMDIGMRHADICLQELENWDKWVSAALLRRADLTSGRIHHTATSTICDYTPMVARYHTAQTAQIMETLTKPSELRNHYRRTMDPIIQLVNQHAEAGTLGTLARNQQASPNPGKLRLLLSLSERNLRITMNTDSRCHVEEKVAPTARPDNQCTFGGINIPVRDTHDLWGSRYDPIMALGPRATHERKSNGEPDSNGAPTGPAAEIMEGTCRRHARQKTYHHPRCSTTYASRSERYYRDQTLLQAYDLNLTRARCRHCENMWEDTDNQARAMIKALVCTDGSTYPGQASAAAAVFVEDDIYTRELWQTKGFYWPIKRVDNHMAELSAINKAIRAVPITINLTIATDSLASIQSIRKALRAPLGSPHLRSAGRPYIMAIIRAIRQKEAAGATVTLNHVRSHTGARDRASVGNSEADRLAKWMAQACIANPEDHCESSDIDLDGNELPYCLTVVKRILDKNGTEREILLNTYGDIRKTTKLAFIAENRAEWAARKDRGELAREHGKEVYDIISNTWKSGPDSTAVAHALRCLTQTPRCTAEDGAWKVESCDRCGTGHECTLLGDLHCPANADLWNNADRQIDSDGLYHYTKPEHGMDLVWHAATDLAAAVEVATTLLTNSIKDLLRVPPDTTRIDIPVPNTSPPRTVRIYGVDTI